jgi:hypothetical protein
MDKYTLHHGCHRGTITSRDSTSRKYDTYEDAHDAYLRHKEFYESIGYQIWFAEIIKPDGSKVILEENPCY